MGDRRTKSFYFLGAFFIAYVLFLYGPMFAQEHPALFPLLTGVVTGVPFFSLRRPSRRWSADEVARAILGGTAAVGR